MDIPAHAVIAWADAQGIYVELPWQGSFTRVTFPPTPKGLQDALTFLQAKQPKPAPQVFHTSISAASQAKAKLAKLGLRL